MADALRNTSYTNALPTTTTTTATTLLPPTSPPPTSSPPTPAPLPSPGTAATTAVPKQCSLLGRWAGYVVDVVKDTVVGGYHRLRYFGTSPDNTLDQCMYVPAEGARRGRLIVKSELPPQVPDTVRVVIISDTHDCHRHLRPMPKGDILLHCTLQPCDVSHFSIFSYLHLNQMRESCHSRPGAEGAYRGNLIKQKKKKKR